MKKMIFLLLASLVFVSAPNLYAAEEVPANESPKDLPPVEAGGGQLVNLNMNRAFERIDDLERNIDDLERDLRYQNDRIRNLERTVNDLRRDRRI